MISVLAVLLGVTVGVVALVGPVWLLRASIEGTKRCPFCRRRLAARKATTCGSCGKDIIQPALENQPV